MAGDLEIAIASDADIVTARMCVRTLAQRCGFTGVDVTVIATAISEIARNIVTYARQGTITFEAIEANGRRGLAVIARDSGPGIGDIEASMQDGYSTGGGLGLGLPGARRLMDEFQIDSQVSVGTTVTMRKWVT